MQPTSPAYRRLAVARQLSVVLMFVECLDVMSEKVLDRDVIPAGEDIAVCVAAVLLGVLAVLLELVERHIRRRALVDGLALAARISTDRAAAQVDADRRARIQEVLEDADGPEMVFQPIADLQTGAVLGYEALARFGSGRPDEWFAEATAAGLGAELELKAIRRALTALPDLPGASPYLSVNASPETLLSAELADLLARGDAHRVVVELTEHVAISDYAEIRHAVRVLRGRGVRLAVDDAGAGYASLRHIAALEPDIIKLDTSFTKALGDDPIARSMVAALVAVGHSVGAYTVAEGVEDERGMRVARDLGVDAGQGWRIGLPAPIGTLGADASLPSQRPASDRPTGLVSL